MIESVQDNLKKHIQFRRPIYPDQSTDTDSLHRLADTRRNANGRA